MKVSVSFEIPAKLEQHYAALINGIDKKYPSVSKTVFIETTSNKDHNTGAAYEEDNSIQDGDYVPEPRAYGKGIIS